MVATRWWRQRPPDDIPQWSCTRLETAPDPRNLLPQNTEFRFTGTLSAATILVWRGLAVDAGETDANCVCRVDTAKTRVVFSISCCSAQPPANPSSTPTTARPRSIRFSSSYLLPNQQVRDGPACKQDCQVSIKTRTRPGAGFFVSEPLDFHPPLRVAFPMTRQPTPSQPTPTAPTAGAFACGRGQAGAPSSPDGPTRR